MISETEQKLFETTGGPAVPDGWQLVPEDLVTHLHDFEEACRIAKTHAVVSPPDIDDRSYWDKQITTIAKVRAALEAQTQELIEDLLGHADYMESGGSVMRATTADLCRRAAAALRLHASTTPRTDTTAQEGRG